MAYYRRLPSGKWQATVKHPGTGKRYTRTDPLKRTVAEWATATEAAIRRGDFVDPNLGKVTLERWYDRWTTIRVVEKATAAKAASQWRAHVRPAFGTWPIASIRSWDVAAWVADLKRRGVGATTIQESLRLLGQILDAAVSHRLLRENPARLVSAPRPPKHVDRFLSLDEADRLLAAVTMPDRGERAGLARGERFPRVPDESNRMFVRLMLEAGLRWGEVAGLRRFRIDVLRRRISVVEVVERDGGVKPYPKSRAGQREVPLTDELAEALAVFLRGVGSDGLVFAVEGRPLGYSNWLKRVWRPAVAAAGLGEPLPTPHDCRHSYGMWLADQGVPTHQIRDLMGHGSLRAVERYIHASEDRFEAARVALGARRAHGGVVGRGVGGGPGA